MIRFSCECGKQLQAREENAGRQVLCPSCGRQQFVPDTADAIQPAETAFAPDGDSVDVPSSRPMRESPREDTAPAGTSGKATASLVLGLLSFCGNFVTGIPGAILGILALRDIGRSDGRLAGQGLAIAGIATACVGTLLSCLVFVPISIGLLLPATQKVREAAARSQSQNNLKQMGLAMHNYHDVTGTLPAAAIRDNNGKPLLSWRVAILPYVEQEMLYRQFKLDEPWDSPNNIKLLAQMPKLYNCPAAIPTQSGDTIYQVFTGNGAAFEKTHGLKLGQDFPDGTSNTILIVEANQPVPWTKPDDLPYSPNQPLPKLGGHFAKGFNAVSVDGAIHFIPQKTSEQTLRPLIQRNDGMPVAFP